MTTSGFPASIAYVVCHARGYEVGFQDGLQNGFQERVQTGLQEYLQECFQEVAHEASQEHVQEGFYEVVQEGHTWTWPVHTWYHSGSVEMPAKVPLHAGFRPTVSLPSEPMNVAISREVPSCVRYVSRRKHLGKGKQNGTKADGQDLKLREDMAFKALVHEPWAQQLSITLEDAVRVYVDESNEFLLKHVRIHLAVQIFPDPVAHDPEERIRMADKTKKALYILLKDEYLATNDFYRTFSLLMKAMCDRLEIVKTNDRSVLE
jgi:hypothetical protein